MNSRRAQQLATSVLALALLVAVGWGVRTWTWVHERRELMSETRLDTPYELRATKGGHAPGQLSWFGESGYERIELEFQNRPPEYQLSDTQRPVLERFRRLFPEAQVVVIPEVPATETPPRFR